MIPADHIAWAKFLRHDVQGFWQRNLRALIWWSFVPLTLVIQQVLRLGTIDIVPSFFVAIFLSTLVVGWILDVARRRWATSLFDPKGGYLRPAEVNVSQAGLRIHNEIGDCIYYWSAFLRLEESRDYVFLFLDKMSAVIIPDRCFANGDQRLKLTAFAREQIKLKAAA